MKNGTQYYTETSVYPFIHLSRETITVEQWSVGYSISRMMWYAADDDPARLSPQPWLRRRPQSAAPMVAVRPPHFAQLSFPATWEIYFRCSLNLCEYDVIKTLLRGQYR